jgi:hypothetical protein
MNSNLNFVFLKDTYVFNGDDRYSHEGPIFNYLKDANYSYTLNGNIKNTHKNLLLIESNHKFQSLLEIPEQIFEFIRNNDVKLFFTSLPDPCNEATFILGTEYIKTKLPKEKYYLLDSNTRLPNIFSFDFFLEEATWSRRDNFNGDVNALGYISEEIKIDELDTFRNKKFISFNRSIDKPHRLSLFDEYLKGGFSDSYFSFLMKVDGYSRVFGKKQKFTQPEYYNSYLPIELDTFKVSDKSNFKISNTFRKDLFLDSCINLVTETSFELNELFISEKIFKPIINYQPFIVFSSYGYLEKLKSYGFKTFGEFWDESYDNIENPDKRFFALMRLVNELNSKSIEDLNELYKSVKHICIYNRQLFDTLEIDTLDKILKQIENEW